MCLSFFLDLVEKGRFKEDYVSNFYPLKPETQVPFNFQFHSNHGMMNSLGVPKIPNEFFIHLNAMMDATQSKDISDLCEKLGKSYRPKP